MNCNHTLVQIMAVVQLAFTLTSCYQIDQESYLLEDVDSLDMDRDVMKHGDYMLGRKLLSKFKIQTIPDSTFKRLCNVDQNSTYVSLSDEQQTKWINPILHPILEADTAFFLSKQEHVGEYTPVLIVAGSALSPMTLAMVIFDRQFQMIEAVNLWPTHEVEYHSSVSFTDRYEVMEEEQTGFLLIKKSANDYETYGYTKVSKKKKERHNGNLVSSSVFRKNVQLLKSYKISDEGRISER